MKFVKARYHFLVNGDWQPESDYLLHEHEPVIGEWISHDMVVYEVVDIKKTGDLYELYMD